MGWFESQIHERQKADFSRMESALQELVNSVTGRSSVSREDERHQASDALVAILGYYGFKTKEPPRDVRTIQQLMDFHTRTAGVMYREVTLTPGWYKDAVGPMLGFLEDDTPVALLPGTRGYHYADPVTGATVQLGASTAASLKESAFCFYRPLPQRELGVRDLLVFMVQTLSRKDIFVIVAAAAAVSLLGLLLPVVNQIIFGPVTMASDAVVLLPVLALLIGIQFSQILIQSVQTLVMSSIGTKIGVTLEASVMMRVLSLPASFFKQYSSGNLLTRIMGLNEITTALSESVVQSLLTALFSLIYIGQIFSLTPAMALPAFLVVLASFGATVVTGIMQVRNMREQLKLQADLTGWQYALIGGVQKIKLAGAERRGFATWAERYAPLSRLKYNGPLLVRLATPITTLVSLVGTIALYYVAYASQVSVGDYMAYSSAFGMVSGAFMTLSQAMVIVSAIKPQLEMAEPILKAEPEVSERRPIVERFTGSLELDNVSFSYGEGLPPVLDNLSLKIRRGQYVAIVGKSGCGKSTLVRLLLGFEKPQRGAVYYDGRDINAVDVSSLRKNIGVVLQDGKLFQGDIFNNIIISAPWLTMDDAWRAADLAGIGDDIRAMPMGMYTMVSEGGGGVSGGQRQRLMIARAIAPNPKILIFDEATSALDNITQRIVAESLDTLKCTRIVVAHRLSTIRTCDRIVLLEGGGIAEDGTYEELIAARGKFYDLVRRQRLEDE